MPPTEALATRGEETLTGKEEGGEGGLVEVEERDLLSQNSHVHGEAGSLGGAYGAGLGNAEVASALSQHGGRGCLVSQPVQGRLQALGAVSDLQHTVAVNGHTKWYQGLNKVQL